MQTQAAPMEPNDGITMIFVTVIGVIWVCTDLLGLGAGPTDVGPRTAVDDVLGAGDRAGYRHRRR